MDHEDEPPPEVARQLLVLLAREWMRPDREEIDPEWYGERSGRSRVLRGQLAAANAQAYELYAQARSGFHEPVRDLRMSRAAWFANWLRDAELVVHNVEQLAAAGEQAPGDDARSVTYLGQALHALSTGERPGLDDEVITQTAGQLHARLATALRKLGAKSSPATRA
jgi:hypothetical protein